MAGGKLNVQAEMEIIHHSSPASEDGTGLQAEEHETAIASRKARLPLRNGIIQQQRWLADDD
jgi:hypothetical protein